MGIISHDLKAPLSAFYSITNSLKNKFDKIDRQEINAYFGRMLSSSVALKLQLENMLNWSVGQTRNISVKIKEINIQILVTRVIIILQEFANEKNVEIENRINEDLVLQTDEKLLGIVLNNLISNAVKFSLKNGQIIIDGKENNGKTVISVKDFGIGMSDQDARNLFVNTGAVTKNDNSDTGLGLIVSRELVEKINGKIWVESELNKGTEIFIEFE